MATEFSIVEQVLSAWSARAEKLPASTKEESDWLAELDGCRLLIEEKMKFDDPTALAKRKSTLDSGRVHGSSTPLRHNNRISGILGKAAGQLLSTSADVEHDLKIVWFTGIGFNAEAKHFQFMSTLYGSTKIFELDKPHLRDCYFFRNGDFFRYKDQLDGAVAAYLTGETLTMKLCLNPYSPNWQVLRDCSYAKNFKLGLIDPVAEEAAGEAYIADTDVSRSDEAAVIRYLEKKYGLTKIMNMDMNMASATVLMNTEQK